MRTLSLQERVDQDVSKAGLPAVLVSSTCGVDSLDGCHAIYHLGPLFLRFVRERGQDWLELAPMVDGDWYFFDDIEIALGWKTVNEVLESKVVEPLFNVLQRIAEHWSVLEARFSGAQQDKTWESVAKAKSARGATFAAKLRKHVP